MDDIFIDKFAQAIGKFEGFYNLKPSRARRNNNPGNLRSWGNYPTEGGYVVFPDEPTGWAALRTQIRKNIRRRLTFREFFAGKEGVYSGYAPGSDNNHPVQYAQFVVDYLNKAFQMKMELDTLIPNGELNRR